MEGPGRDLKVAVHHAGFCLGCCWALMALFIALGIMNVWAMLALAAIVASEKLSRHGEPIVRLAGVAFIAMGLCVAFSPRVADAVVAPTHMSDAPMTDAPMTDAPMSGG
jgi:predicted metal-binding membrane protein